MTGIDIVKAQEGCRLKSYKCPAGVWTIGYGRTTNVKAGDTCSQKQADDWLAEEYAGLEARVSALVHSAATTPNQLGAMTSLAYNIGVNALAGSTLLRKHLGGAYAAAALEFLKWDKAAGKVLPGLTKRRALEAELYAKR